MSASQEGRRVENSRRRGILGARVPASINAQVPRAATGRWNGDGQSASMVPLEISRDQSSIQFATVQLLVVIYLQKFAVGPLSSQISLPLLIMLGHVSYMLITGRMQFSPLRLACYLLFAGSCFISQELSGASFSLPSLVELLLIYSILTVTSSVSESAYQVILKRFISMMIIPALIVLVQYFYSKMTGLEDPISMTRVFPKSVLMQGFFYEAHYPWNSTFQRPNGFFFLEPSFVSMFAASAAIIELTYFKRTWHSLLMVSATALSLGGTGLTMLVIAAPFLLARQKLPVILLVAVAALVIFSAATALNLPIPLLSRLGELTYAGASGDDRIMIPAEQLIRLLSDPSFYLTGSGAGATTTAFGNVWPIVKLTNEYGLLTAILFLTLFLMAVVRSYNVTLAIAISLVFNFTGGYLLNAIVPLFIAIMFCMAVPLRRVGATSGAPRDSTSESVRSIPQPTGRRLPGASR